MLFVSLVLFGSFKLVEHKEICAEAELMALLLDAYARAVDGVAVCIDHADIKITLAVFFYI